MIIRKGQPEPLKESHGDGTELESQRVSELGGLTQFGVYVQTLKPGARASNKHWHEGEDELLFVLEGEATVIEDEDEHLLQPGDAACWPAGTRTAHTVENRSDAPCTYLICGTRAERDVVHYPELGRRTEIEGTDWKIIGADGSVIDKGYWNEQLRHCKTCQAILDRSDPNDTCPECRS